MNEHRCLELQPLRDYLAGEPNTGATSAWLGLVRQWQALSPAAAATWPVQNQQHAASFHAWHSEWMDDLARLERELSALSSAEVDAWPGRSAAAL